MPLNVMVLVVTVAISLCGAYVVYADRLALIRRHRRATLLLVLTAELLLAGWWRWSWTMAPIQTPFDYGTGHVAVVSENWRRHGALRQHFLPVLSTDLDLPEWPYRTEFSQEYFSVPPLAFILHYGATRLIPSVEPVLLGKFLAQFLICASTIGAAVFLYGVFGVWPTLIGLSFLIWGVPFLLWFANGYFAVNVGLAVQLVFVSWCSFVAAGSLRKEDWSGASVVAIHFSIGAALAFLGGFADYLPLAANAIAVVGLLGLATIRWNSRPSARRPLVASAVGVLIGSLAAGLSTIVLYSRQMGFARYRRALATRVADRSGEGPLVEHFEVIRRQMLTAWPPEVLVALIGMLCVVLAWCVVSLVRRRSRSTSDQAVVMLLALALSIVPSLLFHYRALNYVRIHWWFSGTWTIGWAITLCAFMWVLGALAESVRRLAPVLAERGYRLICVVLLGLVVGANLRFDNLHSVDNPGRAESLGLYRSLGRDLPHDGFPLVVTELQTGRPGLFEDFPYPTAYLRRSVILRDPAGRVRLPAVEEPHEGQLVRFGGEDVREPLLRRGGEVYVAYDPDARLCYGADVPLSGWHLSVPVSVCRTSAAELVQRPDTVLGPINERYPCSGPPGPPTGLRIVSNRDHVVVLSWTLSKRTSYVLEAGRTPGSADVLTTDLGWTSSFTASDVRPATYYARIRGKNACGTGGASNEVVVVVQ